MKIVKCEVIPGPSYEYPMNHPDDPQEMGTTWNLLIVATTADGTEYTHVREFDMKHEKKEARDFAALVSGGRGINLLVWNEGTPWDQYKTPQTWDQEKAEALEREANG